MIHTQRIFVLDTCSRIHAAQFSYILPEFHTALGVTVAVTGREFVIPSEVDEEYKGLHMYTPTGGREILGFTGIEITDGSAKDEFGLGQYFETTSSGAGIPYTRWVSSAVNCSIPHNPDCSVVSSAVALVSSGSVGIITDDPRDMRKHLSAQGTHAIPIWSTWDLISGTMHHSDLSAKDVVAGSRFLEEDSRKFKSVQLSRFRTGFWDEQKKGGDICVFCGAVFNSPQ